MTGSVLLRNLFPTKTAAWFGPRETCKALKKGFSSSKENFLGISYNKKILTTLNFSVKIYLGFAFARIKKATVDGTPDVKVFFFRDGSCVIVRTSDFVQH